MSIIKSPQSKDEQTTVKRALVLAGGGVRLAYQAGVLKALEEANLSFDHVDGTSGGIFNTAMLASGLEPDEIAERWRKLKLAHFMSVNEPRDFLNFRMGFGDADGIREKIFPALGIHLEKIRNNRDIVATFNVCNFSDKAIESIPHTEAKEDHLIAGVSLPIFMPAIEIDGDWYSDAVWIKDANLIEAVRRGADELWLVWAIGNDEIYQPGSFNQYVHMIEMSANGGLLEEYAFIECLNERIAKGDSPHGQKAPVKLHVVKPEFPLPLDPDLFLDKIDTSTLINTGYADTKRYLETVSADGVPFDAEATKMSDPGVALDFRQHFTGNLKVGDDKAFVSYKPAFNFRRWKDDFGLFVNSSIYIESFGREISTFKNKAVLNGRSIFVSSEFQNNGDRYSLNAEIPLGTSIDWLAGLEFKKVKLEIIDHSGASVLNGFLTQDIKHRLKGIRNSNLRNYSHSGWMLNEKRKMISRLYSREN